MNKVLGHVRGQDHVNDGLSDEFVRIPVEVLEDVDSIIGPGELETKRSVVILQYGDVIVQRGELSVGVAQESAEIFVFYNI